MTFLTRRYHFSASHRLHSAALSEAENQRVYGKCNNPYGHGHDYTLEICITGEVDPTTGLLLPVMELDRFVTEKILRHFAHRNINTDVPEFAGELVPTTENVVLVMARRVEAEWPRWFAAPKVRVAKVYLQETDRNSFELALPVPEEIKTAWRNESVMVNV